MTGSGGQVRLLIACGLGDFQVGPRPGDQRAGQKQQAGWPNHTFLAGGTSASFYGWMPLYLPELFPTRIRATGQGIAYNFGRILAGVGALFAGQLVSYYDGSYAKMGLCITLVYLVGAAIIWLAPEARGTPLPE